MIMDKNVYQLKNDKGLIVEFMALGGRIKSVNIPKDGDYTDIIVGYDSAQEVIDGDAYMGAICGRVANRTGNGKFTLNGQEIKLAQNDRTNHLHGGIEGFNAKEWNVKSIELNGYSSAFELTYLSIDGEESYPGNLLLKIIYALNNENEFLIDINATTDKTTVVNLTSHPYFNLNGVGGGKVFNHELKINADAYTPLNEMSVPTGEKRDVDGTDMDFRSSVKLGDRLNSNYVSIKDAGGIDHNWIVNKSNNKLPFACSITEPESGIGVEVYTTQPGIQIYAAMHFDGTEKGKGGMPFTQYGGLAIEAQNFPDAINKPNFPNSVLKPGDKYKEKIVYKFSFSENL